MSSDTCIRTERLEIRACSEADSPALERILDQPRVYEAFYLQALPHDQARRIREPWGRRGAGDNINDWVARESGSGRVLGAVQLAGDNFGFFVDPSMWGHGYGREMVLACRLRLPERLGLSALEATVLRENLASRRIVERAGFAFDGCFTQPSARLGLLTLLRYCWRARSPEPPLKLSQPR